MRVGEYWVCITSPPRTWSTHPNVQDTAKWEEFWSPHRAAGCHWGPSSPCFSPSPGWSWSSWPAGGSPLCLQRFHRSKVKCRALGARQDDESELAKQHKQQLWVLSKLLSSVKWIYVKLIWARGETHINKNWQQKGMTIMTLNNNCY